MTKQVKVFNGSLLSSTQTVYTVPAGRVAKITIAYLYLKPSQSYQATLTIGNLTPVVQAPGGSSQFLMPAGNALSKAVNSGFQLVFDQNLQMAGVIDPYAGAAYPVPFCTEYYINAGQSIQISAAGDSASAIWSIMVVEEY